MTGRPDLVIRGAAVYDGSGAPPRATDVALRGDRVAAVGAIDADGAATLDAAGLALAPGFIDVHSHDDAAVLLHPEMAFKVMQGVTTDVVGNCGLGAAPYPAAAAMFKGLHPHGALPTWEGYAGYLTAIERDPPSCNVGALVGLGTLRAAVMGAEKRAPSDDELRRLRGGVAEGLAAGALGISTGLIYEPGRHATTDEIVELARELAEAGGLYATHMRDEGDHLLDAVSEALAIGERAGAPVQISHHKAAGRPNWGKVRRSLALLERARADGLDASADQYPYTSSSTVLAAIAGWVRADGARGGPRLLGPEDVLIAACAEHRAWEGRTLAQLAAELGRDPAATAQHVLEEAPATWVILDLMDEADVREVMRHETTMIGSDGVPTLDGKPHPRLYGTFARVLGHYARDEGVLPLAQAIHKMTALPADKFGLRDRGRIEAGAFADLVLFDPDRIDDVATYDDPHRHPTGIHHVFVNGTAVVRDGSHTNARPGRALRRA